MAEKTQIPDTNEETRMVTDTSRLRTFSENIKLVRERREHIRKCVTVLSVKKPFDQVSTQEILQACHMSRGSLYYYIRSKEDIRSLIQQHTAQGYLDVYQSLLGIIEQKDTCEVLRQAVQVLCRWIDDYQDEIIISLHGVAYARKEQREPQLNAERRNIEVLETIIRKGIRSGEFKTDDPKIVAHSLYLGIRAWADKRWFLRRFYTLDQYIKGLTEIAMKTLKANEGPGD